MPPYLSVFTVFKEIFTEWQFLCCHNRIGLSADVCGLGWQLVNGVYKNLVSFFFNHNMKNFRGFFIFLKRNFTVFIGFVFRRTQVCEGFIFDHGE